MNIFKLDENPTIAAIYNQDVHVLKITLESSQLLCNCYSLKQLESAPKTQLGNFRKHSYIHHPLSKWVKENINNYNWTLNHFRALNREYFFRFDKYHFLHPLLDWFDKNPPELPNNPETEQPQCFLKYPHLMVKNNPVEGYRNYYREVKKSFIIRNKIVPATWTKREIPEWFSKTS